MNFKNKNIVLISPIIIIFINIIVAYFFGNLIGKWAFIPLIIIEWLMFLFFIYTYGNKNSIKRWLSKPSENFGWNVVTLLIGLTPIPIFLKYHHLLNDLHIFFPWIILALINPWIEEFYWRGLLSDYTKNWSNAKSVIFTSVIFSLNHVVFGINSTLFRGPEVIISTLVMGIVWSITYKKTNSLCWVIFSHFLVDFLNLSAPAFLDLFKPKW